MFLVLGENVIKFSLRLIPRWIASEPLHGWPLKTNQSKVAIEYLLWQQSQISGRIQHVGNYGEYTVSPTVFTAWTATMQLRKHRRISRLVLEWLS